jgi:hypothetical protein
VIRALLLGALVLAAVAACSAPVLSADPLGPCAANSRAAGAYPDLEALLPDDIDGVPPTTVDSGRSCTAAALSTYRPHGVTELRYAGATWSLDPGDATVIAVFTAPPPQPQLDQTWVQEFYETGAMASTKTENIEITGPQLGQGGRYWRLETLNDLSLQTVAVWGDDPGLVHVVIVATRVEPGASRAAHNERVDRAIRAVLDGPPG